MSDQVTETVLPVDTLRDAAPFLRRPFTPAAVKFKPLNVLGAGKGIAVAVYIDARLVIERLNLVCPHLWHDEYEATSGGLMWCRLTVQEVTRRDVGEGAGKALVSDALKRAAVHFGIGVSLYAFPRQTVWANDGGGRLISAWQKQGSQKWDARIEDAGQEHLRGVYGRWLADHGNDAFGPALDHGDLAGAQGDADVSEQQEPETGIRDDAQVTTVAADRAEALIETIRNATQVGALGKPELGQLLLSIGASSTTPSPAAIRALTPEQADDLDLKLDELAQVPA